MVHSNSPQSLDCQVEMATVPVGVEVGWRPGGRTLVMNSGVVVKSTEMTSWEKPGRWEKAWKAATCSGDATKGMMCRRCGVREDRPR